jgi:hypothetical protein
MEVNKFLREYAPRLGTRPEYFSGRGATLSDLNSDILEGIYQGLLEVIGKTAAKNFVVLVARFSSLSATAFLNDFIQWYSNGCNEYQTQATSDVDLGPDDEGRFPVAFATMASMMFGNQRDDTNQIRYSFLTNHQQELDSKCCKYQPFYSFYID